MFQTPEHFHHSKKKPVLISSNPPFHLPKICKYKIASITVALE